MQNKGEVAPLLLFKPMKNKIKSEKGREKVKVSLPRSSDLSKKTSQTPPAFGSWERDHKSCRFQKQGRVTKAPAFFR